MIVSECNRELINRFYFCISRKKQLNITFYKNCMFFFFYKNDCFCVWCDVFHLYTQCSFSKKAVLSHVIALLTTNIAISIIQYCIVEYNPTRKKRVVFLKNNIQHDKKGMNRWGGGFRVFQEKFIKSLLAVRVHIIVRSVLRHSFTLMYTLYG